MKLLLDNCVWSKSREDLAAAGHDVVHAGDWQQGPACREILQRYGMMLANGAIITVEPGRVRVRPPEEHNQ